MVLHACIRAAEQCVSSSCCTTVSRLCHERSKASRFSCIPVCPQSLVGALLFVLYRCHVTVCRCVLGILLGPASCMRRLGVGAKFRMDGPVRESPCVFVVVTAAAVLRVFFLGGVTSR